MALLKHSLPALASSYSALEPHRKPDVIIVGGGLTGCLTAAFLRRSHPHLKLQVWERATYPAGRFGAGLRVGDSWADLGAQVLSVVRASSGHPNAGVDGHGTRASDVQAAWEEVQFLVENGTLKQTTFETLGDTEERMKYDGLWAHYWCPIGLGPGVLRRYLAESRADVFFSTRVQSLDVDQTSVTVRGVTSDGRQISENPSSVVLAVPAPEAARLLPVDVVEGSEAASSFRALRRIGYDSRVAVAFSFDPVLGLATASLFAQSAELTLDVFEPGVLHLLAWQGAKRCPSDAYGEPVVIVAHSAVGATVDETVAAASSRLAHDLGLSEAVFGALLLEQKIIDWGVCQMALPMEALMPDVSEDSCLSVGRIVVAGDFMTQSSFLGCYCSAAAAARAVSSMSISSAIGE